MYFFKCFFKLYQILFNFFCFDFSFKLRIKSLNHDLQQDEQAEKVDAEDENEEETTIGEETETRANESESAVVPDTEENDEQPASEITMYHVGSLTFLKIISTIFIVFYLLLIFSRTPTFALLSKRR